MSTTTAHLTIQQADQLDWHWRNQLRPRLDGLTDDEYFWEPVPNCWTLHADGTIDFEFPPPTPAPVTTIAWRLAHLIDVFGPPTAPHFDGPAADHGVGYCGTAEGALRQLDEGHDAWIRDVRRLGAAGLARPQGTMSPPPYADAPIAKLILHIHREVIHHGAEICLLRDLYLRNGSGKSQP